jgi:hypothetical protein
MGETHSECGRVTVPYGGGSDGPCVSMSPAMDDERRPALLREWRPDSWIDISRLTREGGRMGVVEISGALLEVVAVAEVFEPAGAFLVEIEGDGEGEGFVGTLV